MKNKIITTLGILAVAAIALTACGGQNMEELLTGKSWQLLTYMNTGISAIYK